ncbi:MAG: 5-carboxymethyl-2-hydroxymuconate Delta-isomerase [Candidatus Carbobacillus sp.]|nr:5-carboxymethyl-2-hydroxymuconate Delta-isomerase [Candidatus Carbobacillus sp.]
MPHLTLEYTDNLETQINIEQLMHEMHAVLLSEKDIFPSGGIRIKAYPLHRYLVADGRTGGAFIHLTLKIGPGRHEAVKKRIGDRLFKVLEEATKVLYEHIPLALSLEVTEFAPPGTWKKNNMHSRASQS